MTSLKTKHAAPTPTRSPSRWRPRTLLLASAVACLVARVLTPSESAIDDAAGMAFVLAWICIALLAALHGWRSRDAAWRLTLSDGAMLALSAWFACSAYAAAQVGSPRPAMNGAWLWIGSCVGALALRRLVRTDRERRAIVAVMVSLAFALSTFGIEQFAVELPEMRRAYFENPDAALRAQGMYYAPASRERMLFEQRLQSTEPFATFALTNSLAGFLAPWLVVGLACAWQARRDGTTPRWRWLGPLLSCVPIAACLLLTKSRSGMLAVGTGVAFWLLCQPNIAKQRRWWLAAMSTIAIAFAAAWAVGGIDREVFTEAGKSLGYRQQYWRASAQMMADYPLFGVGPGQFQDVYTNYKSPTASEVVADPHNLFLEIAATAGLPAILLFAALFPLGWLEIRRRRGSDSPFTNDFSAVSALSEDSQGWIIGGALLGFLLAWPLGWLAFSGPSPNAFLMGLPAMLISLGLWHVWGNTAHLQSRIILLGGIVLVVNLLAAGGIGIPGVAGALWLLLAIWLGPPEANPSTTLNRPERFASIWAIALAGLAIACYWTAYRPMILAQAARQQAINEPRRAEAHLLAAMEADPYSAQAWRDLATWRFARWQADPSSENWQAVETAIRQGLRLSPRSAVAWRQAGELRLAAHRKLRTPGLLVGAITALETAVQLYPNQADYRADLATALAGAGHTERARTEAVQALELDAATPHLDQKVSPEKRARMQRIANANP